MKTSFILKLISFSKNKLNDFLSNYPDLFYLIKKFKDNYRYFFDIIFDYLTFSRKTRVFREISLKSKKNKTLLIIHYDDSFLYELKVLGYVVQGLRKEGWEIKVLLKNRFNILGTFYYKSFGINKFVFFNDLKLNKNEKIFCRDNSINLLNKKTSLRSLKKYEFENVWIGQQIFSSLSRDLKKGEIDFEDPKIIDKIKVSSYFCIQNILKARKLFENHESDLVITNEMNNIYFGPIVDTAINFKKDVIIQTQPWKDDGLVFRKVNKKTRRYHPNSISKSTINKLIKKEWSKKEENILKNIFEERYSGKWFLQARNQINTIDYDLDALQKKYKLDPNKKVATVFSQVLWDANLFYGDDLFNDAGDWFINTIKAAISNDNINWLIKLHPANLWKRNLENIDTKLTELEMINSNFGKLPSHVHIINCDENISTMSLFKISDFGITIRGTSGLEISCFGKPCITAGTGRYSNLGFTLDSNNKEEYLSKLKNIHLLNELSQQQISIAKWVAYATFNLRIWDLEGAESRFNYLKKGRHPFDHNLFIKYKSSEEINSNCDIRKFAYWVERDEIDYLK